MAFGSKLMMFFNIVFLCITLISIIGMGVVTNSIFNSSNNIITITDQELILGKIALGFYWSLCAIALILSVYIYGYQK